jgi:DNA polymerase-4
MRRMHDKRFEGLTLTLKVRLSDFTTLTRSRTLGHAWNEAAAVTATAIELFGTLEPLHQGVRLIGLSVSHRANDRGQLDLFV